MKRKPTVGLAPTRPPNFYTVIINEEELIRRWGIEMVPLDLVVLVKAVLAIADSDPRVRVEAESIAARLPVRAVDPKAVQRIAALLLQGAAEGALSGQGPGGPAVAPFFADLTVRHPTNDNAELLWHCGNFETRGGDVTIARFDGIGGEYSLLVGHGRGTEGPFTLGTYLWVEVPDLPPWEERIVQGPYIHHVAAIHGRFAPALLEATRYIPGLRPDPVQPTAEQVGAWLRGGADAI